MTALKPVLGAVAACCVLVLGALYAAGGSKTGLILAIVIGVSPLLLYWAFRRPLLVPFGLFVLLLPFNNLMALPQFGTLTKLLGILSALALAFYLVHKRKIIAPSRALALWGAVTLWMALSAVWALDISLWWSLFATFLQLFMLYVLLSLIPVDKRDFRGILALVAIGGLAAAVYGLYFYLHGAPGAQRLWIRTEGGGVNPNDFAEALILPIGVLASRFTQTRRALAKLGLGAGLLVLISAVYISGSRGGLLAVAVLFGYLLWKSRRRLQIVLVMIGAALASAPFATVLSTRLSTMVSTGGAGRLSIWNVGLEAFKHHWLVGVGVGNFPVAYNEAFIHVYQAVSAGWNRGSHNMIEEAAIELGFVGLILILWAWWTQFGLLEHIGKRHPMYDLRIGLEAVILALFVCSMFSDILYHKDTWLAFAVVVLARTLSQRAKLPVSVNARTLSHGVKAQAPTRTRAPVVRRKVLV